MARYDDDIWSEFTTFNIIVKLCAQTKCPLLNANNTDLCINHKIRGRPEEGHTKVSCGVSIRTVSTCRCPMLLLGVCAGLMGGGGMPPPLPPLKFCKEVSLKICSGSGRSPVAQRAQFKNHIIWHLLLRESSNCIGWMRLDDDDPN